MRSLRSLREELLSCGLIVEAKLGNCFRESVLAFGGIEAPVNE